MGDWDGLNRRRFQRIVYPCLVKIEAQDGHEEGFLTHTENISVGGLGIILKKEIKRFTPVKVEIDLIDEEKNILVKGRIVWSVRRKAVDSVKPLFYDIGIQFEHLSDKDKHKLEAAVNKFIQKGHKILKPVY